MHSDVRQLVEVFLILRVCALRQVRMLCGKQFYVRALGVKIAALQHRHGPPLPPPPPLGASGGVQETVLQTQRTDAPLLRCPRQKPVREKVSGLLARHLHLHVSGSRHAAPLQTAGSVGRPVQMHLGDSWTSTGIVGTNPLSGS